MSEERPNAVSAEAELPAYVVRRNRLSIVWIIPITAALIGAWLAYTSYTERGIPVTITFKTADGIEADKTRIKFKNVELGKVDRIEVGADGLHVEVHATVAREAERHLRADTLFWVVRPRIGATGISGLSTIVSGAYITFRPGGGSEAQSFRGLELPPVTAANEPGVRVVLHSDRLGSHVPGLPVLYRGVRVGQVEGHELARDRQGVDIDVFIQAPYDELVTRDTRFWDVSGLRVSMDADGFQVQTDSLETLLAGGVAFDTDSALAGDPVSDGATFRLYASHAESEQDDRDAPHLSYVLVFTGSARGLRVGAPVDLLGVKVGEVRHVSLEYEHDERTVDIHVLVDIYPQNITGVHGNDLDRAEEVMSTLVAHGLRAQLQPGNLLTGELFVEMEMHPGLPPAVVTERHGHPAIPTIPSSLESLTHGLTRVIDKVADLEVEQLIADLSGLLDQVRGTLADLDPELKPLARNLASASGQLGALLDRATQALTAVEGALDADSPLRYEVATALEELTAAARSIRVLARYLERNPDALLFGKSRSGGR
jgi:paraquat-inducible protein B